MELNKVWHSLTRLPWKCIKIWGYSDPFVFQKLEKGHWPLDDLWPHVCWGHKFDSTQGLLCLRPMKIYQSMWIQWLFFKKLEQRSLTPRWPLTPRLLRSHMWLYHNDHCVQVPWEYINVCGNSDQFCKIPHTYLQTTYTRYIHTYYIQNEWSHRSVCTKELVRD